MGLERSRSRRLPRPGSRFDLEQFRTGMDTEFEHGSHDPQTDVTHEAIRPDRLRWHPEL
jgi:hypothetical protein